MCGIWVYNNFIIIGCVLCIAEGLIVIVIVVIVIDGGGLARVNRFLQVTVG